MVDWIMAATINGNFNFPHIDIYNITNDANELRYYEARTQKGYVMYDPNEVNMELDLETMEEVAVTYYCTIAAIPKTFNFELFPYIAVTGDSVDRSYIFE